MISPDSNDDDFPHEEESHPLGHLPVLVEETVSHLITDPDGIYLDLTAGGGGHLKALADKLSPEARLYGMDKDKTALARAKARLAGAKQEVKLFTGSFGNMDAFTAAMSLSQVNGILLDLGLSSYQLDDPSRGFSFRFDSPLDMRFDLSSIVTAEELVNTLFTSELIDIFRTYGEEKQAVKIARAIVDSRVIAPISTTIQLNKVILSVVRPPHQNKTLARVYQALRIVVNGELDAVDAVLPASLKMLKSGGRVAVITYHSLEDRRVKQFIRVESNPPCICPPSFPVCVCNPTPRLRKVTRKSITPSDLELQSNSRSSSARLRVAEKI
ncbi:MAG: 16S rRNA (cytosine(1402)-N(4))-methyltransferase RsmH [candidate division Zixibacteria bacterium]|nr:16S rRNA (cytosine(1402)-N(4))-methyltransferase RsmH [candidate division Zixibacteria bacterium]